MNQSSQQDQLATGSIQGGRARLRPMPIVPPNSRLCYTGHRPFPDSRPSISSFQVAEQEIDISPRQMAGRQFQADITCSVRITEQARWT